MVTKINYNFVDLATESTCPSWRDNQVWLIRGHYFPFMCLCSPSVSVYECTLYVYTFEVVFFIYLTSFVTGCKM